MESKEKPNENSLRVPKERARDRRLLFHLTSTINLISLLTHQAVPNIGAIRHDSSHSVDYENLRAVQERETMFARDLEGFFRPNNQYRQDWQTLFTFALTDDEKAEAEAEEAEEADKEEETEEEDWEAAWLIVSKRWHRP